MSYTKSEMVYHDYKETAQADHDNPYYTRGQDYTELNRTELFEMLYFINHLGKLWKWSGNPTSNYQKIERLIRTKVPSSIRTHKGIQEWLEANWQKN
jgi:hypothetical protein